MTMCEVAKEAKETLAVRTRQVVVWNNVQVLR